MLGRFNRWVSIDYKSVTQDATYNTDVPDWQLLEKVQAEVQDVMPSRSESVRQGLAVARNQVRLRMRWRNDITSDMRITVHGDTDVLYQIIAGPAEIEGRKRFIEMVLERYTTEGGNG